MQSQSLPHRPTIAMPLFDAEQLMQLARVKAGIAPRVLAFFAAKQVGDEFHVNDLTRFVWEVFPQRGRRFAASGNGRAEGGKVAQLRTGQPHG